MWLRKRMILLLSSIVLAFRCIANPNVFGDTNCNYMYMQHGGSFNMEGTELSFDTDVTEVYPLLWPLNQCIFAATLTIGGIDLTVRGWMFKCIDNKVYQSSIVSADTTAEQCYHNDIDVTWHELDTTTLNVSYQCDKQNCIANYIDCNGLSGYGNFPGKCIKDNKFGYVKNECSDSEYTKRFYADDQCSTLNENYDQITIKADDCAEYRCVNNSMRNKIVTVWIILSILALHFM
eukprot:200734_1